MEKREREFIVEQQESIKTRMLNLDKINISQFIFF